MTGRRSLARVLVAAVIVSAFAPAFGDAFAASISLSTRPIALDPTDRAVRDVGRLHFLGGLDLRSDEAAFGGLSGLSATADGRLTAVTDRGHWFTARIVRDRNGRLVDLVDAALGPLLDTKGRPAAGEWRDAEALERLPGGDWLVSFEGRHRVWRYAAETGGLQGLPAAFPTPKGIAAAPPNGGLEALTPLPDGRILMLAESLNRTGGSRAGWLVGQEIEPLGYRTARDFKPTDAALLPNGDVLVLSRYFKLLGGFKARLERISASAIGGGAVLKGELLARFAPPLTVDNYEGVAVTRDADGATLVYILSDDNFNFLQRTLLLLFRLDG